MSIGKLGKLLTTTPTNIIKSTDQCLIIAHLPLQEPCRAVLWCVNKSIS